MPCPFSPRRLARGFGQHHACVAEVGHPRVACLRLRDLGPHSSPGSCVSRTFQPLAWLPEKPGTFRLTARILPGDSLEPRRGPSIRIEGTTARLRRGSSGITEVSARGRGARGAEVLCSITPPLRRWSVSKIRNSEVWPSVRIWCKSGLGMGSSLLNSPNDELPFSPAWQRARSWLRMGIPRWHFSLRCTWSSRRLPRDYV